MGGNGRRLVVIGVCLFVFSVEGLKVSSESGWASWENTAGGPDMHYNALTYTNSKNLKENAEARQFGENALTTGIFPDSCAQTVCKPNAAGFVKCVACDSCNDTHCNNPKVYTHNTISYGYLEPGMAYEGWTPTLASEYAKEASIFSYAWNEGYKWNEYERRTTFGSAIEAPDCEQMCEREFFQMSTGTYIIRPGQGKKKCGLPTRELFNLFDTLSPAYPFELSTKLGKQFRPYFSFVENEFTIKEAAPNYANLFGMHTRWRQVLKLTNFEMGDNFAYPSVVPSEKRIQNGMWAWVPAPINAADGLHIINTTAGPNYGKVLIYYYTQIESQPYRLPDCVSDDTENEVHCQWKKTKQAGTPYWVNLDINTFKMPGIVEWVGEQHAADYERMLCLVKTNPALMGCKGVAKWLRVSFYGDPWFWRMTCEADTQWTSPNVVACPRYTIEPDSPVFDVAAQEYFKFIGTDAAPWTHTNEGDVCSLYTALPVVLNGLKPKFDKYDDRVCIKDSILNRGLFTDLRYGGDWETDYSIQHIFATVGRFAYKMGMGPGPAVTMSGFGCSGFLGMVGWTSASSLGWVFDSSRYSSGPPMITSVGAGSWFAAAQFYAEPDRFQMPRPCFVISATNATGYFDVDCLKTSVSGIDAVCADEAYQRGGGERTNWKWESFVRYNMAELGRKLYNIKKIRIPDLKYFDVDKVFPFEVVAPGTGALMDLFSTNEGGLWAMSVFRAIFAPLGIRDGYIKDLRVLRWKRTEWIPVSTVSKPAPVLRHMIGSFEDLVNAGRKAPRYKLFDFYPRSRTMPWPFKKRELDYYNKEMTLLRAVAGSSNLPAEFDWRTDAVGVNTFFTRDWYVAILRKLLPRYFRTAPPKVARVLYDTLKAGKWWEAINQAQRMLWHDTAHIEINAAYSAWNTPLAKDRDVELGWTWRWLIWAPTVYGMRFETARKAWFQAYFGSPHVPQKWGQFLLHFGLPNTISGGQTLDRNGIVTAVKMMDRKYQTMDMFLPENRKEKVSFMYIVTQGAVATEPFLVGPGDQNPLGVPEPGSTVKQDYVGHIKVLRLACGLGHSGMRFMYEHFDDANRMPQHIHLVKSLKNTALGIEGGFYFIIIVVETINEVIKEQFDRAMYNSGKYGELLMESGIAAGFPNQMDDMAAQNMVRQHTTDYWSKRPLEFDKMGAQAQEGYKEEVDDMLDVTNKIFKVEVLENIKIPIYASLTAKTYVTQYFQFVALAYNLMFMEWKMLYFDTIYQRYRGSLHFAYVSDNNTVEVNFEDHALRWIAGSYIIHDVDFRHTQLIELQYDTSHPSVRLANLCDSIELYYAMHGDPTLVGMFFHYEPLGSQYYGKPWNAETQNFAERYLKLGAIIYQHTAKRVNFGFGPPTAFCYDNGYPPPVFSNATAPAPAPIGRADTIISAESSSGMGFQAQTPYVTAYANSMGGYYPRVTDDGQIGFTQGALGLADQR